jgi:hypothetical protein
VILLPLPMSRDRRNVQWNCRGLSVASIAEVLESAWNTGIRVGRREGPAVLEPRTNRAARPQQNGLLGMQLLARRVLLD